MRLFIAVTPPTRVRDRVENYASKLRQTGKVSDARWVRGDQYHVTLRFLGNTPVAWKPDLLEAVREVSTSLRNGPEVRFGSLVAFPRRSPRVLALASDDASTQLLREARGRLHARLEARLPDLSPPDDRPLRPHLTLARLGRTARSAPATHLPHPPAFTFPPRIDLIHSDCARAARSTPRWNRKRATRAPSEAAAKRNDDVVARAVLPRAVGDTVALTVAAA